MIHVSNSLGSVSKNNSEFMPHLVRAIAPPLARATFLQNVLSGMRTPIVARPGFNSGLNHLKGYVFKLSFFSLLLFNGSRTVTRPGKRSYNNPMKRSITQKVFLVTCSFQKLNWHVP